MSGELQVCIQSYKFNKKLYLNGFPAITSYFGNLTFTYGAWLSDFSVRSGKDVKVDGGSELSPRFGSLVILKTPSSLPRFSS